MNDERRREFRDRAVKLLTQSNGHPEAMGDAIDAIIGAMREEVAADRAEAAQDEVLEMESLQTRVADLETELASTHLARAETERREVWDRFAGAAIIGVIFRFGRSERTEAIAAVIADELLKERDQRFPRKAE